MEAAMLAYVAFIGGPTGTGGAWEEGWALMGGAAVAAVELPEVGDRGARRAAAVVVPLLRVPLLGGGGTAGRLPATDSTVGGEVVEVVVSSAGGAEAVVGAELAEMVSWIGASTRSTSFFTQKVILKERSGAR